MKTFLVKIAIFLVALFVVDRIAGKVLYSWCVNTGSGRQGKFNYICDYCKDDLLIFGSSRADCHYKARMIEDSLGISSFNCGIPNSGIILNYVLLQMIEERYQPEFIIMDLYPDFDLDRNDRHMYLRDLKVHYDNHFAKEMFDKVDPLEKYKMYSYLYRYNSNFLHLPKKIAINRGPDFRNAHGELGFNPKNEPFHKPKTKNKYRENEKREIDSLKLSLLESTIKEGGRNSNMMLVVSPFWCGLSSESIGAIRRFSKQYNVPFFDFSNDPKYLYHDELFYDYSHLNGRGAEMFTRDVVSCIERLIHNNEISIKQ